MPVQILQKQKHPLKKNIWEKKFHVQLFVKIQFCEWKQIPVTLKKRM